MSSPIDDTALEAVAADVAQRLRVVHKRAPREIRRRVRETLEAVFRAVEEGAEIAQRLTLARRLESLSAR